jgi:hypothetical protein
LDLDQEVAMQIDFDVDVLLGMTQEEFTAAIKTAHDVSETFLEAMQPTIAAAFRNLPLAQRRVLLSTTARAFARQAATEASLKVASRGLDRRRELIAKAHAEQLAGTRRKPKIWVPHAEYAAPDASKTRAG